MSNIREVTFHPSGDGVRKVQDTLERVKAEEPSGILILFFDSDDNVIVRSSSMMSKDALWLLHLGIRHVMEGEEIG